ncbi:hypothetical protein V8C86DRAFT_2466472 [Haematococcus lacustris]
MYEYQQADSLETFTRHYPYANYRVWATPAYRAYPGPLQQMAQQQQQQFGSRKCSLRPRVSKAGLRVMPKHRWHFLLRAAGSFSGRKAMQPSGGHSSLSLADGSNYQPYARHGAYQGSSASILGSQPAYAASAGYNSNGYGNPDLSSQLNLPNANRRPPSSGRRAVQPTTDYAQSYQPSQQAAAYGSQTGAYNTPQYNSYSNGQQGSYANGSPSSGYSAPQSYGAGSPSSYGAGAASSYAAPSYGGGSYGATPGYGAPQGYGATASDAYSAARPRAFQPQSAPVGIPQFQVGQKGQFCGKISMQPPGGKQTLNLFG